MAPVAVMGTTCDIYDAAGNPCVAAHSLIRALYKDYNGPLYQVKRSDNNKTMTIQTKMAGGFADSAAQDTFCSMTTCTVEQIFDQSPKGNHIGIAPAGGAHRQQDHGVNASKEKLMVGGNPVYSAYFEGGMGYRRDNTSGIAVGDEPESMYMVTSGTHYNGGCCFDYGNAETNNLDTGAGSMEAIYWGNSSGWGKGVDGGPWVMADLENGLWASNMKRGPTDTPVTAPYATAMVKGKAGGFCLKAGDATEGKLKTMYEGVRPDHYNPMKKQGAIILGIGGDNSDRAIGTFYEGVMASGYTSDATDDAVQMNIVAAGYGK